jgi:hypothetical protein
MTALVNYNDVIFVTSNDTWDGVGTNYIDNRATWSNLDDITLNAIAGSDQTTGWVRDSGPNTLPAAQQEPRAFCLKGQLVFTFTGTTLVARINTDYGWGSAHPIKIDGVNPTTISGVLSAINTVSCDSASYQLGGPAYVDVLIADGLPAGTHTVTITPNFTGNSFFSIAGFKVYDFSSKTLNQRDISLVPAAQKLSDNLISLTLSMKGGKSVLNPTLTWPSNKVLDTNLNPVSSITQAEIDPTTPMSQSFYPIFTGTEVSGNDNLALTLSALYQDPNGSTQVSSSVAVGVGNPAITVQGTAWSVDNDTPSTSERIFTSALGSGVNQNHLQFTFQGDALSVTVEQDFGWGDIGIYAADNTTLLQTVTCNADITQEFTANLTGFGTGSHTVILRKKSNDGKFIVFLRASWNATLLYSQITETVNLNMETSQPLAMPVDNVTIGQFDMTFDVPNPADHDFSQFPVRTNADVAYTEVLTRFPTYAVCYQPGFADVLSQYDILIVDPFAAHAADVLAWQAKGIKVFGYISFGEEDGFYSNRYDFYSANGPYAGNQTGPGGTAGYFLKGGYGAREIEECTFDNQANGSKTCAQHRAEYFQGTGRCSGSCTFDNVNGYVTFIQGGACGAGFTSANFWTRNDANSACTNAACPSFHPVHQVQLGTKCPLYDQADNAWLQDFSLATPNAPDQNGVWGSWYTDPTEGKGWRQRIESYYLPTVIGGPVAHTNETVTVKTATITAGSVFVFDTAFFPIDEEATITLTTMDGTVTYAPNTDFSWDMKTGAFVFNAGIATPVTAGQQLLISYTQKGHRMDGVFMDTIDDADVYPLSGDAMATLVNTIKQTIGPDVMLLSNRGFTNLAKYIQSCHGVMFESWLVDYNFETGVYSKISDPDSIAFNEQVNEQLYGLRAKYVFDVYSLNYCDADSTGDDLRAYCREEDAKKGYLSWTSTIQLNVPMANNEVPTPQQKIKTNAFQRYKIRSY